MFDAVSLEFRYFKKDFFNLTKRKNTLKITAPIRLATNHSFRFSKIDALSFIYMTMYALSTLRDC